MIRWDKAKTSDGTWGVGRFIFGPPSQGIFGTGLNAGPDFTYKTEDAAQVAVDILNKLKVDL